MSTTERKSNMAPLTGVDKRSGRILEKNPNVSALADGTVIFLRDCKISKQPILSPSNDGPQKSDR